jgi:hypothetical protein
MPGSLRRSRPLGAQLLAQAERPTQTFSITFWRLLGLSGEFRFADDLAHLQMVFGIESLATKFFNRHMLGMAGPVPQCFGRLPFEQCQPFPILGNIGLVGM